MNSVQIFCSRSLTSFPQRIFRLDFFVEVIWKRKISTKYFLLEELEFTMKFRDPKLILVASIMLIIFGIGFGFVAFPVFLRAIVKSVSEPDSAEPIFSSKGFVSNSDLHFLLFFFGIFGNGSKQICCLAHEFVQSMRNHRFISISSFTFLMWQIRMMWSKEVSSWIETP